MPYVDQVTAALALARGRLANAAQQPSVDVLCGRLLARALEYATQAVLVAWGFPVKVTKVQQHFDPVLAAHLDPDDADLTKAFWATEGQPQPDLSKPKHARPAARSGNITVTFPVSQRVEV